MPPACKAQFRRLCASNACATAGAKGLAVSNNYGKISAKAMGKNKSLY
jgi:hypothetical protein